MRLLTYLVAATADGFIATPDGAFDVFLQQGDHLAHLAEAYPETLPAPFREAHGISAPNRHFDTVLMGRKTWAVGGAFGLTSPYPHLRQYVMSRSLTSAPASDVKLVRGDPVETVRRLKAETGLGIWLCGGGELASVLGEEIDELILKVNPVVVGAGIPLFRGGARPRALRLVSHQVFESGVCILRYRVQRAE